MPSSTKDIEAQGVLDEVEGVHSRTLFITKSLLNTPLHKDRGGRYALSATQLLAWLLNSKELELKFEAVTISL